MKKRIFCVAAALAAAAASIPAAAEAPFVRTKLVSPTGASPQANGALLRSAIDNLSPAPSASNRWLVKIEPGIYDMNDASNFFIMRPYVDVEGSGVLQTFIRGYASEHNSALTGGGNDVGVVIGASSAEIRELTIECLGGVHCTGMTTAGSSPRISSLRILVTSPEGDDGYLYGLYNEGGAPALNNVEIRVDGIGNKYGIGNASAGALVISSVRNSQIVVSGQGLNVGIENDGNAKSNPISGTSITASGGLRSIAVHHTGSGSAGLYYVEDSALSAGSGSVENVGILQESTSSDTTVKPIIRGSKVVGGAYGIKVNAANTVLVANSQVVSTTTAVSGGTVRVGATWIQGGGTIAGTTAESCTGVWNDAFTDFGTTCP